MRLHRLFAPAAGLLAAWLLVLTGCHSAFIDATISNHTASAIPLVELDYPTASFGTENLAPGKDFHYRFKVLGTGATKVIYTDNTQQEKHAAGPTLNEGDEGPLVVIIAQDGVHWQAPPPKR